MVGMGEEEEAENGRWMMFYKIKDENRRSEVFSSPGGRR